MNKMNKTIKGSLVLVFAAVLALSACASPTIAQDNSTTQTTTLPSDNNTTQTTTNSSNNNTTQTTNSGSFYLQNPLEKKFTSVGDLIDGFVGIFTYLAILAAVLMIIYVGLRFVLAQGNTEELKKRKEQLLWIMVGVGVVIGARLIVSVVLNTLKATGTVSSTVIDSADKALQ